MEYSNANSSQRRKTRLQDQQVPRLCFGDPSTDEERKRREHRQDVGGKLGARDREEYEHDDAPEGEEQRGIEALLFLEKALQGGEKGQQPGRQSGQQDRNEEPHRLVAA